MSSPSTRPNRLRPRHTRFVAARIAIAAFAALIAACSGSSDSSSSDDESQLASRQQCIALREHILNLRFGEDHSSAGISARQSMASTMGDAYLDQCTQSHTVRSVRCAIATNDTERLTSCLNPRR